MLGVRVITSPVQYDGDVKGVRPVDRGEKDTRGAVVSSPLIGQDFLKDDDVAQCVGWHVGGLSGVKANKPGCFLWKWKKCMQNTKTWEGKAWKQTGTDDS